MRIKLKIDCWAVTLLLLFNFSELLFGAGDIHSVAGVISYPGGGYPPASALTYTAFIVGREADVLNYPDDLLDGYVSYTESTGEYQILVHAFSDTWSEGDSLHINAGDGLYGGTASKGVRLTTGAYDYLNLTLTGSSLSVSLSSFQAIASADGITVEWVTESEVDNVGFYISRSNDGENYSRISGLIYGSGNTSERHTYTFTDTDVVCCQLYWYKLEELDIYGKVTAISLITASLATSISDPYVPATASSFELHACYPNPFNPTTMIQFDLPRTMQVTLDIFDSQGRCIRSLVQGAVSAGTHVATWDGTDASGNLLSSGTYFSVLRSGNQKKVGKLLLMK